MYRTLLLAACALSLGCVPLRGRMKPIALTGNEIRVVQSRFAEVHDVPQFHTAAEHLKVEVTVDGAKPTVERTVLWHRASNDDVWRRGPESAPMERWIMFSPSEMRYWCRASVVYSDGVEAFVPTRQMPPSFCIVVDRTPPHIEISHPGTLLTGTTPQLRFTVWDGGLGDVPTAEMFLSTDDGRTWQRQAVIPIRSGENTYRWLVPDQVGSANRLRLVCRDLAGNEGSAELAHAFTILPGVSPSVALTRLVFGPGQEDTPPASPVVPALEPVPHTDPPVPPDPPVIQPADPVLPPPGEIVPVPDRPDPPLPPPEELAPSPPPAPRPIPAQAPDAPPPPSSPIHDPSLQPTTALKISVPGRVKAGHSLAVLVTGIPPRAGTPSLLWRSNPAEAWQPTGARSERGSFLWLAPAEDTNAGQLRVEIADARGAIFASCQSGPIVVDGTPPDVRIDPLPSADPRLGVLRVSARDKGSEVMWINLYRTADGGASWSSVTMRMESSFEEDIPRADRELGFFAQAQDALGNRSPAPRSGTVPMVLVEPLPDMSLTLDPLPVQVLKAGARQRLTWRFAGAAIPGAQGFIMLRASDANPWEESAAVDIAAGTASWEVPGVTIARLWLRLEVRFSGVSGVLSDPVGPYAVAAEPPLIEPDGSVFPVSGVARIALKPLPPGPADVRSVTAYLRPKGGSGWMARPAQILGGELQFDGLGLAQREYDLTIGAEDVCGNATPPPTDRTEPQAVVVIDTTPPAVAAVAGVAGPFFEGVRASLQVSADEPVHLSIVLRNADDGVETVCLTRTVGKGVTPVAFMPPAGFSRGTLALRAADAAGNITETRPESCVVKPSVWFTRPTGGETLRPGETVMVSWDMRPDLLQDDPTIDLYWEPAANAPREELAVRRTAVGTFRWDVPDRTGDAHSLRAEVRVNGRLRAVARMAEPFAIRHPQSAPVPAVARTAPREVLDESRVYTDSARVWVDELQKALAQKDAVAAENYRKLAEKNFQQAIEADASNAEAWWGYALLFAAPLAAREDAAKVEEFLARTVAADPRHWRALTYLGAYKIKSGKFAEAENALGAALNIQDHTTIRYNLGLALMNQGKHTTALEQFRRAAQGDPPVAGAYVRMVECLIAQQQFVQASEALDDAVRRGSVPPAVEQGIRALIAERQARPH